jgi:hypothetical protein
MEVQEVYIIAQTATPTASGLPEADTAATTAIGMGFSALWVAGAVAVLVGLMFLPRLFTNRTRAQA